MKPVFLRSERGQNLALLAGAMFMLMAVLLVVIDGGNLLLQRRKMQNAADSGALAGAQELCLGRAEPTAVAAARQLALQNGAAWATPEVSGSSVQVTAGEDAMLFLGGFLGQASSPVGASAEAGCGAPTTGCTTWPITLEVNKYRSVSCGQEFFVDIENSPNIDCTNIYDCSHVFLAPPESTAQRGWWSSPIGGCGVPELQDAIFHGYPDYPVQIGQCISGAAGNKGGAVQGGPPSCTSSSIDRWLGCPNISHTVTIPLYSSLGCTADYHTCEDTYRVAGFGCFDVLAVGWGNPNDRYEVPFRDPDDPNNPSNGQRARLRGFRARVNCNCTLQCSANYVPPGPNDVTVPYLTQ